jgi:hypothetical protein
MIPDQAQGLADIWSSWLQPPPVVDALLQVKALLGHATRHEALGQLPGLGAAPVGHRLDQRTRPLIPGDSPNRRPLGGP